MGLRQQLGLVFFPLAFEEVEVANKRWQETRCVLFVEAEGTDKREHRQAALASNAGTSGDVLARLLLDIELDPFTAVRVDGAGNKLMLAEVTQAVTLARLEDHAWAANQL